MDTNDVSVVLAHGAWADGSSWTKVISPLIATGHKVSAAPLPLTSFDADVEAVERTLERVPGQIVLVGHASWRNAWGPACARTRWTTHPS
jgi:hypothetical protein